MGKCRLLAVFNGYQLRELNVFLSYISRLESRKKLPPGKEKSGLRLAAKGSDAEWGFSQTNRCLRSCLLLLASIGFVIKSRLPLIRPLSLASIAFVMTGVLARLSISLSKHCDLVPNCLMLAVVHSQQASHLDIQIPIVRGEAPLKPHSISAVKEKRK